MKHILEDNSISWKAKGVYAYLSTVHDYSRRNVAAMEETVSDGSTATRSGIDELVQAGYVEIRKERNEDGTFRRSRYIVNKRPRA